MSARRCSLTALLFGFGLLVGCPPAANDNGNGNDNSNTNDNGNGNANSNNNGNSNGNDNPDDIDTGILVTTPEQTPDIFDLFAASGVEPLSLANDMNEVVEVDPGTYKLTGYFNEAFVFADDVEVLAGQITTVVLGGIRVTTIPGSEAAIYDIHANSDDTLLQRPNDSDIIIVAPPGVFRLHEYFNDAFIYAEDVAVVAGQVTTVPLGAFNLMTAEGTEVEVYDVLSGDGATVLSQANDTDEVRPLPPGDFRITAYFNDALVYTDVTIAAGALSTFQLGALLYNGSEPSYDVYDAGGTNLLVRPASMGEPLHLPPGSYVLKDYFTDTVLGGVTIAAGVVTTFP